MDVAYLLTATFKVSLLFSKYLLTNVSVSSFVLT